MFKVFSRSRSVVNSAFKVLSLDKELMGIPILSAVVGLLAVSPFIIFAVSRIDLVRDSSGAITNAGLNLGSYAPFFWAGLIIVSTVVSVWFQAAIVSGALQRYRGQDPTLKSCFNAVRSRIVPLSLFGAFSGTVGFVLSLIEERVPFAGKIAVWLVNAAWAVATLFAVAVILDDEKTSNPLVPVRKSAGIVKKAWGDSVVTQLGLMAIGLIMVLGVFVAGLILSVLIHSLNLGIGFLIGVGGLMLISLIAVVVVLETLKQIIIAAVYYYATTGEAPEHFDAELLKKTFTVKKARKLFA